MISGILILLIFVIMTILMMLRKISALYALPCMAVLFAIAGGVHWKIILSEVINAGAFRLSEAIIIMTFGSMLAQLIEKNKIATAIIKIASELGSEKPFVIAFVISLVVFVLFVSLGGLGAIVMVGTIALPILLTAGFSPVAASSIFLFGISFGGIFNLMNWGLYINVFGLTQHEIFKFAFPLGIISIFLSFIFIAIECRRGISLFDGASLEVNKNVFESEKWLFGNFALISPLVPVLIIWGTNIYKLFAMHFLKKQPSEIFDFPIISAFIIGIVFCYVATYKKGNLSILTSSLFDGISQVAPAIVLLIGIGMLLKATQNDKVILAIKPFIKYLVPKGKFFYLLTFTLLAPLSLYRGPLNIWGLGLGIGTIMLATGRLSPQALMAMLLSVGQIQGVCDPTNTHNVWVANFTKVEVEKILFKTLPYVWILAFLGLLLSTFFYF